MSAGPVPPEQHEFPARGRGRLWLRFFAAGLLIVALTAGATATGGLLQVKGFVDDLRQGGTIKGLDHVLTRADVGDPQTILLIGSDHRATAGVHDARSDTMILVRLDPDASATTVLSIPRDLKVDFQLPNGAYRTGAKINETYSDGGEALTAKVITHLLDIKINHVVNVDFKAFKDVVDAIGCVYADVDHRYYHSNLGLPSSLQYAEIDISAGYQKLCGSKALDFVRYRHGDSDFVRAARQQDFLRQVKAQYGIGQFLNDPHAITKRAGKHIATDKGLQSTKEFLNLANLVAFSATHPVRQIKFPAGLAMINGISYVVATPQQIQQARDEFLAPPPKEPRGLSSSGGGRHGGGGHAKRAPGADGLADVSTSAKDYAIQLGAVQFPIYYPTLIVAGDQFMTPIAGMPNEYPRKYRIKGPDGKMRGAYRLVVFTGHDGNYYGVQGTSWTAPPILDHPSADSRVVNGKKLLLFYDGSQLRTVGWKTSHGSYWVQNTLQEELTNRQMLRIAGSLTRLGH